MSRAGRVHGPQAKQREVHARLRAAVAAHQEETKPEEPVAVPAEVQAAFRAQRVYMACKQKIIARYPPLWPGEVIGVNIAEQWLRNLAVMMQRNAVAQMHARAAEAGIVLPA